MQTETQLVIKDDSEIIQQRNELVTKCNQLTIKDDLTMNEAVELERFCKMYLDGPATIHDEIIDGLHQLHKKACAKRNELVDNVKSAWQSLKNRRASYQDEQNRKREEKQRQAEAEARRIEAEKQAKIQAKIDEENRIIEEKRKEEARIQAAKDAVIKKVNDKDRQEQMRRDEVARRERQFAIDQENERRAAEKTAALQEKKENVYVAPRIVAPVMAPAGASVSYDYEPTVINKNIVPEQYKIVDLAMLKKMQKAAKGTLVVPGVSFTKKAVGALRGIN